MPTQTPTQSQFTYKVRDRAGKVVTGKVEAESEQAVSKRLHDMGGIPLEIRRTDAGLQRDITFGLPARVKLKDLAVFARMFATMITSGLTLLSSLSLLAEQSENPEMRKTLRLLQQDVESGGSLSESMAKYPKVFPPIMMNMTKAGETGGFLDTAMLEVAQSYEAEVRLRGKIKAALTYPVVVFFLAILMCGAMLIFVVPVFEDMFANLGGELPLPTRVLVWMSGSLRAGIPIVVVLLIVTVVLWRKYSHHDRVREVLDPLKLRLPVFGVLLQKIALARFARNFGSLMTAGVPILQCLDTVAETTGSIVISRALRDVGEAVRQGESLAAPLAQHKVFPPLVVKMLAVGEDTGALPAMLEKISEFYDQEVEATTEALTALIEPLMIAFLGAIVGSMIVALYLPIFKVFDLIQ